MGNYTCGDEYGALVLEIMDQSFHCRVPVNLGT